jgi:hypothetical protein
MKRQFAVNRNRSAIRIVSRSSGQVVGHLRPHGFRSYKSNETRTLDKALNRKAR